MTATVKNINAKVVSIDKNSGSMILTLDKDSVAKASHRMLGELKRLLAVGVTIDAECRDEDDHLRIVSINSIVAPDDAPATDGDGDVEAIEQMVLEMTAGNGLTSKRRFIGETDDGKSVVVQVLGSAVMFAMRIVAEGKRVRITGKVNPDISGNADFYFDASRVEKAAAA